MLNALRTNFTNREEGRKDQVAQTHGTLPRFRQARSLSKNKTASFALSRRHEKMVVAFPQTLPNMFEVFIHIPLGNPEIDRHLLGREGVLPKHGRQEVTDGLMPLDRLRRPFWTLSHAWLLYTKSPAETNRGNPLWRVRRLSPVPIRLFPRPPHQGL